MSNVKFSQLNLLTEPAVANDFIPIVDSSDDTMSVAGTNKRILFSNLANSIVDVYGKSGSGNIVLATSPVISNATLGGNTTLNSTSYSFGSGAAAAFRNALSLGTMATQNSNVFVDTTSAQTVGGLKTFSDGIATTGALNTSIRTGSTFELRTALGSITTIGHNATANRAITLPDATGTVALTSDSRFTDARTPTAHSHGNITNTGAIGNLANQIVVTGPNGVLTTASSSGIDTRGNFPNADVSAASSGGNGSADANKLVRFNSSGVIPSSSISGLPNFGTIATRNSNEFVDLTSTQTVGGIKTFTGQIQTTGATAAIFTTGNDASIFTNGENASIFTEGSSAAIATTGINAEIYTSGAEAHISTGGPNAYIQTSSTFKITNGVYTTTLSGTQTANREIAFPNLSGTVALTASATGVPDKLTNGTVAGTLTINSTSYTYGTGAAAAHRTALGLGTAAVADSTAFAAASHSHGAITAAGAIGTTSGNVVTTGTGGVLTATLPRSGIDSRTTFPNNDVNAATPNAAANTLAKRNGTGGISFSNLSIDQGTITLSRQFDYEGQAANSTLILDRQNGSTLDHVEGTNTITFPLQNGTVALLENSVQYRLDTSPNQLAPEDNGIAMLLQYGDSVWFKDTNDVSILLAGSGNQGGGGNEPVVTEVILTSNDGQKSFGTFPAAGQYRVRFDNFSSSNYATSSTNDNFGINTALTPGTFSYINYAASAGNPEILISDNVTLDTDGSLNFAVNYNYDAWDSAMYVEFLVTVNGSFDWSGTEYVKDLLSGQEVNFRVTLTPESYTPTYTLSEVIYSSVTNSVISTTQLTVPPGEYLVNVEATPNIISYPLSHAVDLQYDTGDATFSVIDNDSDGINDNTGTLLYLEPEQGFVWARFEFADPTVEPVQSGTINVTVTAPTTFYLGGTLPDNENDAAVAITFSLVNY